MVQASCTELTLLFNHSDEIGNLQEFGTEFWSKFQSEKQPTFNNNNLLFYLKILSLSAHDEDFLYPDAIKFPLEVGYDSRFHNHFSQNKKHIESFIHDVIHLSSFYFKHTRPKLPSVVNWIIQPNIKFLSNLNISADELCQNRRNVTKINIVKEMRRVHSVAKVYTVLPFYDVKCLCSGGREWGREESHSH